MKRRVLLILLSTALLLVLLYERFEHNNDNAPDNPILVQALLEHGADPNTRDATQSTALMDAVYYDYEESARLLLKAGADIHAKDQNEENVIFPCLDSLDLLPMLVANGADINEPNNLGWTPLMRASWGQDTKAIQALIDCHVDVNRQSSNGETALDFAINR